MHEQTPGSEIFGLRAKRELCGKYLKEVRENNHYLLLIQPKHRTAPLGFRQVQFSATIAVMARVFARSTEMAPKSRNRCHIPTPRTPEGFKAEQGTSASYCTSAPSTQKPHEIPRDGNPRGR